MAFLMPLCVLTVPSHLFPSSMNSKARVLVFKAIVPHVRSVPDILVSRQFFFSPEKVKCILLSLCRV